MSRSVDAGGGVQAAGCLLKTAARGSLHEQFAGRRDENESYAAYGGVQGARTVSDGAARKARRVECRGRRGWPYAAY